jgi:hypothetical protein
VTGKTSRLAVLGAGAISALALPFVAEMRVKRAAQPLTDSWRRMPIASRGQTLLGISFRPLQARALGLDSYATLESLLAYPFQCIRIAAYWNLLEPEPGKFDPDELDRQVDAAEKAGKQIILSVGAVKSFGYPEYFVPAHHLQRPLAEGHLVEPAAHQSLLAAATTFMGRVVDRFRDRESIIAWQVEHEAVDPLGMEHSWRLATDFVYEEVAAVRAADPTRPIVMSGFLPTSSLVSLQQWWRTRDQGDSLELAQKLADIVGIDYYPRHALLSAGSRTLYLDGRSSHRQKRLLTWAQSSGRRLMVTEGQAEPWEAVTTPPNPPGQGMYSCLPEQVLETYNRCLNWSTDVDADLFAYLFWGAEYWVLRRQCGDDRYLQAFARVLDRA